MNWLSELRQIQKQERVLLDGAFGKLQQAQTTPSLAEKKALEAEADALLQQAIPLRHRIFQLQWQLAALLAVLLVLGYGLEAIFP